MYCHMMQKNLLCNETTTKTNGFVITENKTCMKFSKCTIYSFWQEGIKINPIFTHLL
jgi:hypothetical protein